uniref:Uncharacterized protein n=1 Tax=Escherichia coli TaxID=562 RepID=A0A6G6AM51_ECOLX|nr:hypothetical protein [Escherichia coli]UWM21903.1 hypothetical protein [Morganella morganii]UWM22142.1 hypothetical protein [Klebsiella pneumoniae]QOE89435.1 hypothetical protein TP123_123 [Escherichia coli]UMW91752.1 hypothetical protein [Escherichia coli]
MKILVTNLSPTFQERRFMKTSAVKLKFFNILLIPLNKLN